MFSQFECNQDNHSLINIFHFKVHFYLCEDFKKHVHIIYIMQYQTNSTYMYLIPFGKVYLGITLPDIKLIPFAIYRFITE
jgi:hypothetical protein